jgi:DNA modification methylase
MATKTSTNTRRSRRGPSHRGPSHRDPRRWRIIHADCLTALPKLDANSVEVVITDPPYGIGISGMAWDGRLIAQAAHRDTVLRRDLGPFSRGGDGPGRRLPRTSSAFAGAGAHAGAYNLTPRGMQAFQAFSARWTRECLRVLKPGGHLAAFASPRTAHRLACGLEDASFELRDVLMWLHGQGFPKSHPLPKHPGWGTALKPAYEPIILARKPLAGSTEQNLARHRTGALHIDACRSDDPDPSCQEQGRAHTPRSTSLKGRWPANVSLSHAHHCTERRCAQDCPIGRLADRARFFYCPKTNRRERDAGCEHLRRRTIQTYQVGAHNERKARARPVANIHPTVKPIELMRWLVRLITPPDGLVLDPFTGSGSTGIAAMLEGARFIGIEREDEYIPIARARIRHWSRHASSERSKSTAVHRRRGDAPRSAGRRAARR